MISAVSSAASGVSAQSFTGLTSITSTQASNMDSSFGKLADALILSSLLNQDDKGKDRMQLGELLMFGEALSAASKISQQMDTLFAGISQLAGAAPVQSI
jgi:hypothetical protein